MNKWRFKMLLKAKFVPYAKAVLLFRQSPSADIVHALSRSRLGVEQGGGSSREVALLQSFLRSWAGQQAPDVKELRKVSMMMARSAGEVPFSVLMTPATSGSSNDSSDANSRAEKTEPTADVETAAGRVRRVLKEHRFASMCIKALETTAQKRSLVPVDRGRQTAAGSAVAGDGASTSAPLGSTLVHGAACSGACSGGAGCLAGVALQEIRAVHASLQDLRNLMKRHFEGNDGQGTRRREGASGPILDPDQAPASWGQQDGASAGSHSSRGLSGQGFVVRCPAPPQPPPPLPGGLPGIPGEVFSPTSLMELDAMYKE